MQRHTHLKAQKSPQSTKRESIMYTFLKRPIRKQTQQKKNIMRQTNKQTLQHLLLAMGAALQCGLHAKGDAT